MKCREFENDMSLFFSIISKSRFIKILEKAYYDEDWSELYELNICPPKYITHLADCSDCYQNLLIYLDIRHKIDYHTFPCFHLAAASIDEWYCNIKHNRGEFIIATDKDENSGVVISFCPWCGIEIPIPDTEFSPFQNTNPPIEVNLYKNNRIKCPICKYSFSIEDPAAWDGWRHFRCGQQLILKDK